MVTLHDVGPDSDDPGFTNEMLQEAVWIVYWYQAEEWKGRGEAVSLLPDGRLIKNDLDHCSCYGPIANWGKTEITPEDLVASLDHVLVNVCTDRVARKVLELLGIGG